MLQVSSHLPLGALTGEGILQFLRELYERASRDWLATAYWAGVWAFGFVVTFLLIRMLFTHWGDRDVTKKTLAFSLLAHTLIGMLSTTVILATGSPPEDPGGDRVPIRRVVIAGDHEDPHARGNQPGQDRFSGHAAPWKRLPEPERPDPARTAKASLDQAALPDAEPPLRTARTGEEPPLLPVPKFSEPAEDTKVAPTTQRADRRVAREVVPEAGAIAEETAAARPEVGAAGPGRLTPDKPGLADEAPTRQMRRGATEDVNLRIETSREPGTLAASSDPQATVRRQGDAVEPRRSSGPAPAAAPADEPGTPASAGSATGGGGPAGSPAITRSQRRGPGAGASGAAERVRPAPGAGAGGIEAGPDRRIAARAGSIGGGDGNSDSLQPRVLRSDAEGAISKDPGKMPAPYRLRSAPQRRKIAADMGANDASEKAVEASLAWLARNQHRDGYWRPIESTLGREPDESVLKGLTEAQKTERARSGLSSETGLTSLALLAFLGANYTHVDNLYADNVDRALRWLIAQQDARGFLGGGANRYAGMYCHGMATIALGEAYGMTKDESLREPLARAVQYIVDLQYPDGGWRYIDWRQMTEARFREGDMSMFGWQLMALKSAQTAGLAVPQQSLDKAIDFLVARGDEMKKRELSKHGGLASYRRNEIVKPSMTAEALFCKQMLGIKRTNAACTEAVNYLLVNLPRRSQQDLYYWYYGTLAMYHHGGDAWRRWNDSMRDNLVADQRTDGDFAGSWNPRAPWGDYGGRVFSTALSTLCLEVYYRFLPLYQMGGKLDERTGAAPKEPAK